MNLLKKILIILLILVIILLLILAAFLLIKHFNQAKERPLIQIQQPYNHEKLVYGRDIIIHATAIAQDKISKMELWVDDELISEKVNPAGEETPNLVISAAWLPYPLGGHDIIVRAISKRGVTSQASIEVEAIDPGAQSTASYIVQEGDTLESIADAFGISEESLIDSNGGLDPGSALEVSDELTLPPVEPGIPDPFTEEPSGEAEEPSDDLEPPAPSTEEEPLFLELYGMFFHLVIPAQLQIEVLSLETQEAYSFVHCYASLADAVPQWVPDADFNQETDESFSSMNGSGLNWDVALYLAGENALPLSWVESEPVPLDISCVGIADGGLEAIELGHVVDDIEPEQWGITQSAYSSGGESTFYLTYKVAYPAKGLDTTITPPFNLQLSEEDHELSWDYPADEVDDIDGFAVLLNDTLQWTVPSSVQTTSIPVEWFILPCGDEYRFTVVAFRMGYPDGDYSLPSDPAIVSGDEVGSEGCNRTLMVTFETLTIGALGRNPSPVYGSFFANEQLLEFDGRPIEGDNFPTTLGLRQNETVEISRIMYGFGNNQTTLVVELPPGNWAVEEIALWVGFDIYQGGNKVCSGDVGLYEHLLAGTYHGRIETDYPVGSYPDWCVVNYTIQPVGTTPVVDPGAPPPLPDLEVVQISADPASGRPRIHVRNVGQSTWTDQTVVARVTSSDGEAIGTYEWPNQTIAPGETRILSHGGLNPTPPLGICVLLDPENVVEEEIDRLITDGILAERHPYCRPLPDLIIEDISFDNENSQLRIDITNRGENPVSSLDIGGTLNHENVLIWLTFAEGRPLTLEFPDVSQNVNQTMTYVWPLSELERERMRGGYTAIVNPGYTIAETNYENNEYTVAETARLRILWGVGWANFCETGTILTYGENLGGKNTWQLHLTATVQNAGGSERIVGWDSSEFELTWREGNGGDTWCHSNLSDWFEVAGDEALVITPWAGLDIASHGYRWISGGSETLTAADDFGGTTHFPIGTDESCFEQPLSYPYICYGSTFCSGGCGVLNCSWLGDAGEHIIGPIPAYSDDITNTCYWSTTYMIFKEVDE
jgi:LysM repeat protein